MTKQKAQASPHPYDALTPDVVIRSLESVGFEPDGRLLALNSYENRVYQVGIEDGPPVVAKFYRPDRFDEATILEEHAFALELASEEIPVVPPLVRNGKTLFACDTFRFAVFERRGGRWPELASREDREWIGRFLGRIHAVGRRRRFVRRPTLTVERLGHESRDWLLCNRFIPEHLQSAYETVSSDLLAGVESVWDSMHALAAIRIHGDCHPGNILWTDAGPHFVDLDDCMQGPPIQDLWMLLSGNRREMGEQLGQILDGYSQFAEFDAQEILLIESLRSLRIMHYACWLARRMGDPAFPRAFPWFAEVRYWEQHVLNLREQLAALHDEPLRLD